MTIKRGTHLVKRPDPRGWWMAVEAAIGEPSVGVALSDESQHGSVLVDVWPEPVQGGDVGVWMATPRWGGLGKKLRGNSTRRSRGHSPGGGGGKMRQVDSTALKKDVPQPHRPTGLRARGLSARGAWIALTIAGLVSAISGLAGGVRDPALGAIFVAAFLGAALAILTARAVGLLLVSRGRRPGALVDVVACVDDAMSGVPHVPDLLLLACEDHGRCLGCPRVLAQLEAIVRHQGEESLSDLERSHLLRLRILLAADTPMPGESETSRQRRIAARVTEVLVVDGCSPGVAHAAVWSRGKADRKTFAAWLASARAELMVRTS